MEKLLKGRTSIIIAHRLSTIEEADKIIVLDRGELVEQGSHDELMAMKGLYANLYWTQMGIMKEKNGPQNV
jgi:ABC-type multidrug transport system fused ATPase/permease subunit